MRCEKLVMQCSSSCELPARRLAGLLGNEEAALMRYTIGRQTADSNGAAKAHKEADTTPVYAAGGEKMPIMFASVKVSFAKGTNIVQS